MGTFVPTILIAYFGYYSQCFSKPNYKYFCGFIISLLIVDSRRTVTRCTINRHCSKLSRKNRIQPYATSPACLERFLIWDTDVFLGCGRESDSGCMQDLGEKIGRLG